MGWFESICLGLAWERHKNRKEEKEKQDFLAERLNGLGAAISELSEVTTSLTEICGPIGLHVAFIEEVKLAPFYAIGEVLSAQGQVYPEQEKVLKSMLTNMNPVYNYAQFTEAAIHRTGVFKEYWEVVGIDKKTCGSLWLTLFELMYRSRQVDAFQSLINQLHLIVVNFALLGDRYATLPYPICSRITECMNYHVNAYQQTPYIHALMLLQKKLFEIKELSIESHFFLQDESCLQNGRNYYIFKVYEKSSYAFCGSYAVKEIRTIDGKLDYSCDLDEILLRNEATGVYDPFYLEKQ